MCFSRKGRDFLAAPSVFLIESARPCLGNSVFRVLSFFAPSYNVPSYPRPVDTTYTATSITIITLSKAYHTITDLRRISPRDHHRQAAARHTPHRKFFSLSCRRAVRLGALPLATYCVYIILPLLETLRT
jgi:hypothetical protein